jgi:hypothetical protein
MFAAFHAAPRELPTRCVTLAHKQYFRPGSNHDALYSQSLAADKTPIGLHHYSLECLQ